MININTFHKLKVRSKYSISDLYIQDCPVRMKIFRNCKFQMKKTQMFPKNNFRLLLVIEYEITSNRMQTARKLTNRRVRAINTCKR